jgi:putative transposase
MSNVKVVEFKKPVFVDALTELLRNSARQVIASAVESELEVFLAEMSEVLANGKRRVVRNGYLPERDILTGVGRVSVQVLRIRDRGEAELKVQFKSSLIPPYMRRTATLNEVLPLLYLKGISEASFVEVLSPLFGDETKNLSQ